MYVIKNNKINAKAVGKQKPYKIFWYLDIKSEMIFWLSDQNNILKPDQNCCIIIEIS